jgi:hypothetical protein
MPTPHTLQGHNLTKGFIDLSSLFKQYTRKRILKNQLKQQLQGDYGEYRLFIIIKIELELHSFYSEF